MQTESLKKAKTTPPMSILDNDIKQSGGKAPAVLELWGMRSIPSLLLLPGPLWSGLVAPDRVRPMGQIELFDI